MSLNTPTYCLSIEPVEGRAFLYGFHLGTDLALAKKIAVEKFEGRNRTAQDMPGARDIHGRVMATRTVALFLGNKMIDVFDGAGWSSDRGFDEE